MEQQQRLRIWDFVPLGGCALVVLGFYAWSVHRPTSSGAHTSTAVPLDSARGATGALASVPAPAAPTTAVAQPSADGDDVRCPYTQKSECGPGSGCADSPVGTAYLLMPRMARLEALAVQSASTTLRRCDQQGCSPIDVVVRDAGAGYLTLSAADRGYLVKLARTELDGGTGAFVEVATLGLTALTYFGQCRA